MGWACVVCVYLGVITFPHRDDLSRRPAASCDLPLQAALVDGLDAAVEVVGMAEGSPAVVALVVKVS